MSAINRSNDGYSTMRHGWMEVISVFINPCFQAVPKLQL